MKAEYSLGPCVQSYLAVPAGGDAIQHHQGIGYSIEPVPKRLDVVGFAGSPGTLRDACGDPAIDDGPNGLQNYAISQGLDQQGVEARVGCEAL